MKLKLSVLALAGLLLLPTQARASNGGRFIAKTSLRPVPVVSERIEPLVQQQVVHTTSYESVRGGRVLPGNNCVACVFALTGRSQPLNAGLWVPSHTIPHIGSIIILRPGEQGSGPVGHVAEVVGIRGNIVDVDHCNYPSKTWFYDNHTYF